MEQPALPASEPEAAVQVKPPARPGRLLIHRLWQRKIPPAFWTIAGLFSLVVNIILVAALLLLARELFGIKALVSNQLIGGLHQNFIKMDQAHIQTTILVSDTIQVKDRIPVVFDLPLSQGTEVRLLEDTPVRKATIFLNGSAVPLDLILRKGTSLNIKLDLTVPVSQTLPVVLNVPIKLKVPVDIALDKTQLHEPFVGLQNVVSPYDTMLAGLPNSWRETSLCTSALGWLCSWLDRGR